jgi:hypothetical protein
LELDFALEIKSHYARKEENERSAVLTGVIGSRKKSYPNAGAQDDQSEDAHLLVNIKAGSLPLPVGITHIIELYSKSIHPTEINEQ